MKRVLSLDILRGLTVVGMILVNNTGCSGNCFSWLQHARWHGCVPADLVYPFFLFVVGASCWFAMRKSEHQLTGTVAWKILKRGALIFGVGLLYNWLPFDFPITHLRIMGVLQRIALVYVLGSFLALWLKSYLKISVVCGVILLGYWAVLSATGFNDPVHNLAGQIDLAVFGPTHVHHYNNQAQTGFDPEGLLGTLPATVNMLLGYMTAMWIGRAESNSKAVWGLLAGGGGLCVVALCWDMVFPFNKHLWTSSFVLYTCGWAMLLWTFLLYVIDICRRTKWTGFFAVFGTNALFTYVLSAVLSMLFWHWTRTTAEGSESGLCEWLTQHIFSVFNSPQLSGLLWGITILLICWLITWPLYRRKIFVKL